MFHEISPHKLNNQYLHRSIKLNDFICIYKDQKMLIFVGQEGIELPTFKDLGISGLYTIDRLIYLFSIDEAGYFLLQEDDLPESGHFRYIDVHQVRYMQPVWKVFAASLGVQLYKWYDNNRFCGGCGSTMSLHGKERAVICPECNRVVYPVLSPSVIVAVTNGDKILLTIEKNYTKYALISGYTEFGETMEQTVEREVMEEVGLHVKNIRYYKSQPWPFTSTLLSGFFAELDGSDAVTLQENELTKAVWFERDKIPENGSTLSLSNEMIEVFQAGNQKVRK